MSISFSPFTADNLGLIEKWLKEPHVKEFWDDGVWEESYEKYIFRTSSEVIRQFIVYIENAPIGYIQYYWASKVGDGWWKNSDDSTVGIDFYIGEPIYLGKGNGAKIINAFLHVLFKDEKIKKIIADPSLNNARMIHILEKCGFLNCGKIKTPDGEAQLLELTKRL